MVGPFLGDIDGGPTKSLILHRRSDPHRSRGTSSLPWRGGSWSSPDDLRLYPNESTNITTRPAHRASGRVVAALALDRWTRDTVYPPATTMTIGGIGFRITDSRRSSSKRRDT